MVQTEIPPKDISLHFTTILFKKRSVCGSLFFCRTCGFLQFCFRTRGYAWFLPPGPFLCLHLVTVSWRLRCVAVFHVLLWRVPLLFSETGNYTWTKSWAQWMCVLLKEWTWTFFNSHHECLFGLFLKRHRCSKAGSFIFLLEMYSMDVSCE